ncbi:hypothetical protein F5H01DRAFT_118499 [Linnemannia elongata]|nr:hypothetical protein F5H01DRAFT_118499 [Linnemannia elongata]
MNYYPSLSLSRLLALFSFLSRFFFNSLYALLFPSLLRSFFFVFFLLLLFFRFLPSTFQPILPSLPLSFFFPETPSPLHLIINSKVMIKQHSFPQSSQSFTTSSFYSCNLILPVHTQDSLVVHFFFHQKCRLNFSLFCLSLFFLFISFPSVFFFLSSFSILSSFFCSLLSSFFFLFLFLCSLLSFLCHCLQQPIVLLPPSSLMNPPRSVPLFCSFFFPLPHPLSPLSSFSLPIFSFSFSFLLMQENTLHVICPFSLTSLPLSLPSSSLLLALSFLCAIPLSLLFFVFISCQFTHHQHLFSWESTFLLSLNF